MGRIPLAVLADKLSLRGIELFGDGVDWEQTVSLRQSDTIDDLVRVAGDSGVFVVRVAPTSFQVIGCSGDGQFVVPLQAFREEVGTIIEGVKAVGESSRRLVVGPCDKLPLLARATSSIRVQRSEYELRLIIVDDNWAASVGVVGDLAVSLTRDSFQALVDSGATVFHYALSVPVGGKINVADEEELILELSVASGESDVIFQGSLERVQAGFSLTGEILETGPSSVRLLAELEISSFSGERRRSIRRGNLDQTLWVSHAVRVFRFWGAGDSGSVSLGSGKWTVSGRRSVREFSVYVMIL